MKPFAMSDEKVSLDTAKLLKEKKFDIYVHGAYVEYNVTKPDEGYNKGDVEIETMYFKNDDKDSDYSNSSYTMYATPTQSLVQKWLREKYNIHIGIDYDIHGWMFFITDLTKPNSEINWSNDNYKTYEDTLEAGFKIALRVYIK